MASEIFRVQGLSGWKLRLDLAKSWLGRTHHEHHTILLSRPWVGARPVEATRQTILHEVAHALVGPGEGHGIRWQEEARRIGYEGNAKALVDSSWLELPWIGTCAAGHRAERALPPSKTYRCGVCPPADDFISLIAWSRRREAFHAHGPKLVGVA